MFRHHMMRFGCLASVSSCRSGSMIDAGNSATYGAISAAPTVSTLTLLSGRHPSLSGKEMQRDAKRCTEWNSVRDIWRFWRHFVQIISEQVMSDMSGARVDLFRNEWGTVNVDVLCWQDARCWCCSCSFNRFNSDSTDSRVLEA